MKSSSLELWGCAVSLICQHTPASCRQAKHGIGRTMECCRGGERYPAQSGQGQARPRRGGLVDDGAAHPHHRDRPHRQDRGLRHALHRPGALAAHRSTPPARSVMACLDARRHAGGAGAGQHAGVHRPRARFRRARHHRAACALGGGGARGGQGREVPAARRARQHRSPAPPAIPVVSGGRDAQDRSTTPPW